MNPIIFFSVGWKTKERTFPIRLVPRLPPRTRVPVNSLVVIVFFAIPELSKTAANER